MSRCTIAMVTGGASSVGTQMSAECDQGYATGAAPPSRRVALPDPRLLTRVTQRERELEPAIARLGHEVPPRLNLPQQIDH